MKGQNFDARTPRQYIDALDEPRRSEIRKIDAFIRKTVPKLKPVITEGALGYGPMHYKYASGREGDCCKIALASNAAHISIYICAMNAKGPLVEQHAAALGKASCGKSCIRFKRFSDLDQDVLKRVLQEAETCGFGV